VRLDARLEAALADRTLDAVAPLLERLAPHRVAIELRRRSWVRRERAAETLAWIEAHGAVWVGVDAPPGDKPTIMPPLDAVTRSDLAYLRAHGRNLAGYVSGRSVAERFGYRYSDAELEELRGRAEALAEEAAEVHVMFNNNARDDAPVAAQRMRELLARS
jgi:uncharacterized protein YecE (DUF72 family)